MDLPTLSVVLKAALSSNLDQRKAAEKTLYHYQYSPQHLLRLLQIIVDGNCDMGVRQVLRNERVELVNGSKQVG
ncbi:importin beta-like SAD2 [Artemisia annua]|uniref:Importin beta-like SAD2 n=1 Tax=Artemisia annua TaxID=35608 RepID=A0A2U1LIW8_ARTAN|nr:importin beta-like SAD2 [Artemisia annua]